MDATDMNFRIHCIETEAYSAILRAFIAQSDVLSWGKEGLITELRKELNVSDFEHRELLLKVDSDDSVRMIREWRRGSACDQGLVSSKLNASGSVPSSMGHASHKRLKTPHAAVPSSPNYVAHTQPSPGAVPPSLATHLREGRWGDDAAKFSFQGNVGQSVKSVGHYRQTPSVTRGRGPLIVKSKKGFKRRSDIIKIRATDKLIREIERLIHGEEQPDPILVEKAKVTLRDHETAILEALDKLADLSDGDSPNRSRHRYSHKELERDEQGNHGQVDRLNDYLSEGFGKDYTDRAGNPCINVQADDERTP